MNLERIVGLLLGVVALATVAYLAKVIAGILLHRPVEMSDLSDAVKRMARSVADYYGREAKPVNEHLIASPGKVIAHSDSEERPMRVRVGLELWFAKSNAPEQPRLPVGTPVIVTAVEGTVLTVEASTAE